MMGAPGIEAGEGVPGSTRAMPFSALSRVFIAYEALRIRCQRGPVGLLARDQCRIARRLLVGGSVVLS